MPARCSACIVTYKCKDRVFDAVRSLLAHTKGVSLTLYVVDNASGDGVLDALKAEFPEIITVQNPDNLGFGHGHNTVLPLLESDYHFVVNPDITLDSDTLSQMVAYMDAHPDIGLLTPMILYPDGKDQQLPKRDPTVAALVGRRIFKKPLEKAVRHYQMLDEDLSKPTDIEFATGCFFCMRTDLFREIGGFDERFFIYYEDMDITRRARAVKRAVYYPDSHVYHAWERSSAHSLRYFIILVKGMFVYFGKWGWRFK